MPGAPVRTRWLSRTVVNIHDREYLARAAEVSDVVATLSTENDRLWPSERWPRMKLDSGLAHGSRGGHGPIRYRVAKVDLDRRVIFDFTGPPGFDGWHAFSLVRTGATTTLLRHEIRMSIRGRARLTWPLFFRPLHDALIEDALDKVAGELGTTTHLPHRDGAWVSLLRRLAGFIRTNARRSGSDATDGGAT